MVASYGFFRLKDLWVTKESWHLTGTFAIRNKKRISKGKKKVFSNDSSPCTTLAVLTYDEKRKTCLLAKTHFLILETFCEMSMYFSLLYFSLHISIEIRLIVFCDKTLQSFHMSLSNFLQDF